MDLTPSARLAAILLSFACIGAAPVPSGTFVSERLPNGMQVSILADPRMPLVATQVWYHVGSANEAPASRGLAHLFEHLMFGPTAQRGGRDYWEHHHRHGGRTNAYTTPDETVYVSEIPPEHALGVLQREAERMRGLLLSGDLLDNEKRIVTEELRLRIENDPLARIFQGAIAALLGEHPYAILPTGTKEDLAQATLESCRAFYDRFYHPDQAHLVIVGPVHTRSMLKIARELFGPIPAGGQPAVDVAPLDRWSYPDEVELRDDIPPVEIAIAGFPLPAATSPDRTALTVLGRMLSGGQIDRMREELVTRRGKAVDAGTQLLFLRRGGAIVFYSASVPYRRKKTAFRLLEQSRQKLAAMDWLTEESLSSTKRAMRRDELSGAYYAASQAQSIGVAGWWRGEPRTALDRAAEIDTVTLDQVRGVFLRYVIEPEPVRVYIRPDRVPAWIRMFGWLYPLVD